MERIERFFERYADILIWLFIALYTALFSYITILKYHSFGYHDWDLASDAVILWNSVNGRLFYYPFLEGNIFGTHLYLIILLLIPIYALFRSPITLLVLQSLFLALAAYPLYKLARLKLNRTFSLVIGLAYLLYPSLGFINLFETHYEIFEIFFFFFALYFFEKERFGRFVVFILLAISCKENASLAVFMFGIYALLRRRTKRWVLVPSLLGLVWFFAAVKAAIPYFNSNAQLYQGGFMFTAYYRHLGETIPQMIKTIITTPAAVMKFALTRKKLLYLYHLFLPTGFLAFLSPAVLLMTLPILMQNLLSSGETHSAIRYHYVAIMVPFIFSAVINSFRKLLARNLIYEYRMTLLAGFLFTAIVSGSYLAAPQLYAAQYIKHFRADYTTEAKQAMIDSIPKHASVIATFQFLPKLANRQDLYSMHFVATGRKMYSAVKYDPPANLKYALIDFNEPLVLSSFFPPEAPANIHSFLEDGNWRVLMAADDVVLFKRDYLNGYRLLEPADGRAVKYTANLNIGNKVILLGYNKVEDDIAKNGLLHITFYWKRLEDDVGSLGLYVDFLGPDGDVRFTKSHSLGYRMISGLKWPKDKIIKEHYNILFPPQMSGGAYSLRIRPFELKR